MHRYQFYGPQRNYLSSSSINGVAGVLGTPCLHGPSYRFPWLEKEERFHVHVREGQGGELAPLSGYLEDDRGETAETRPWMLDLVNWPDRTTTTSPIADELALQGPQLQVK